MNWKQWLVGAAGLATLGFLAFFIYAWEPGIDPIERPAPASFSPTMVERGRILAAAGDCATCHSAPGRPEYAGGLGLPTPFGVLYTTNITPDPEHGIGNWSIEAFRRAMREGVRRDGAHLYPGFPYTAYKNVTQEDTDAIYAFLMTREPAQIDPPDNSIIFPFNFRFFQAGWKMLFFSDKPMKPDPKKSAQWNRGAYLAEGLGHCSACHTPRNLLGAEKTGADKYGGAVVEGWFAPALNGKTGSPLPWTRQELFDYLRTGATSGHGVSAGPMAPVIADGLSQQSDADIMALATYSADIAGAPEHFSTSDMLAAMQPRNLKTRSELGKRGEQAFMAGCVACHYNPPGKPINVLRPEMAVNTAVTGPEPATLIQAIMNGVSKPHGHPLEFMPGYAGALSDNDIAAIATYLHETYATETGAQSRSWDNLVETTRELRQENKEKRQREAEAAQ